MVLQTLILKKVDNSTTCTVRLVLPAPLNFLIETVPMTRS
jgi:hypothetical protein